MKQVSSITGVNLIVLLIAILVVNSLSVMYEVIYFLPLIVLFVFNAVLSIIYFYKGNPNKAKSFILSCLLILIIGGSSCVTIKFRSKAPKKKPVVEKTTVRR
jgi:thiol:disulfide interchange protein